MSSKDLQIINLNKKWSLNSIEKHLNDSVLSLILIAIVAISVYCITFAAPFELDDFGSIQNNSSIRNPLDIVAMWNFYSGRIIAYITFSINYFFHDTAVAGYHIVNLLIHIFNGFLIYLILKIIFGFEYFKEKSLFVFRNTVCFLSAILFIVHPLNTSSVTYIVQRIASLATLFMLFSIYYYLKFRVTGKNKYFIFTVIFILIAMFTKENAIIVPLIILLLEFLFLFKKFEMGRIKRLIVISILIVTMTIIPITLLVLDGASKSDPNATLKASTSMSRLLYLTTEINVVSRYSELMLIPDRQNFDYQDDFPRTENIFQNNAYVSLFFIVISILVALLSIRKNKLISLGIFWYYIGLSVESTIISIKDVYFEHRLYFSSIGFVIFLVGIIFAIFPVFKKNISLEKPMLFFLVFCIFMIPLYSGLSFKRNYLFSSDILLWGDVVKKAPNSDRARSALGTAYLNNYEENKDFYLKQAEKHLIKALKMNTENSVARSNLAKVFLLQGKYKQSILQSRIQIVIKESTYAYHNLGKAYEAIGEDKKALNAYLKGYKLDNKTLFLIEDTANLYYKLKNYKKAKFYYNEYNKNKFNRQNKTVDNNLKSINEYLNSIKR